MLFSVMKKQFGDNIKDKSDEVALLLMAIEK